MLWVFVFELPRPRFHGKNLSILRLSLFLDLLRHGCRYARSGTLLCKNGGQKTYGFPKREAQPLPFLLARRYEWQKPNLDPSGAPCFEHVEHIFRDCPNDRQPINSNSRSEVEAMGKSSGIVRIDFAGGACAVNGDEFGVYEREI